MIAFHSMPVRVLLLHEDRFPAGAVTEEPCCQSDLDAVVFAQGEKFQERLSRPEAHRVVVSPDRREPFVLHAPELLQKPAIAICSDELGHGVDSDGVISSLREPIEHPVPIFEFTVPVMPQDPAEIPHCYGEGLLLL